MYSVKVMEGTADKIADMLDNTTDPRTVEVELPKDKKEARKVNRQIRDKGSAYDLLHSAHEQFEESVEELEANGDSTKTVELRNVIYEKFNNLIAKTDVFCELLEISVPYIENEWKYYNTKSQEADLEGIDENVKLIKEFMAKFPVAGHQKKIDTFITSIISEVGSKIGCYQKEVEIKE